MSDYKRLTYKDNMNEFCDYADCVTDCGNCYLQRLYNRLAELEGMIEQNVLIKLPCKVGDTVYHIDRYWQSPTIEEYEVYGFTMNDKNELRILVAYGMFCMSKDEIFLTQAEAEAELAKIRGEK